MENRDHRPLHRADRKRRRPALLGRLARTTTGRPRRQRIRHPILTSRFYHLYSQEYRLPYEHRSSRDFGDFACKADFVSIGGKPFKTTYCTQPSKKFIKNGEPVSDLYLTAAQIGEKQQGFTITMMLTGIQENLGKRVMAHLLEQITWQQN